jgi:hypothetical protein
MRAKALSRTLRQRHYYPVPGAGRKIGLKRTQPQLGLPAGVHVRRVHYRIVSMPEPVKRHNGEPYENTMAP